MLNNFNFGNGPFRADQMQIHDGSWMATIAIVIGFMIFNTVEWSIVGMALINLMLALHVLKEHKNLNGDSGLWDKRLMAAGAWILSIFLVAAMPVFALINYAVYAKEIREKFSDKEYKIAWSAYMRILGITAVGVFIYLVQIYAYTAGQAQAISGA